LTEAMSSPDGDLDLPVNANESSPAAPTESSAEDHAAGESSVAEPQTPDLFLKPL
jgi:hypothetical protein